MPAAWTDGTLRRSNVTGRDAAADCSTGRVRPACSAIYYRRKTVTKSCESLYDIHYMLCFRRSNNMSQRQIPLLGGALSKVPRRAHFPDLRVSCGRLRDVVLPCSTNNSANGRTGRKRTGSHILCPREARGAARAAPQKGNRHRIENRGTFSPSRIGACPRIEDEAVQACRGSSSPSLPPCQKGTYPSGTPVTEADKEVPRLPVREGGARNPASPQHLNSVPVPKLRAAQKSACPLSEPSPF